MYNDIINLLNLEQFHITFQSIETIQKDYVIYCYLKLERTVSSCAVCGGTELSVHDYQNKKIKHSISTKKPCFLIYKARRYRCKYCNHIFYENNPFALKYEQHSSYTIFSVLDALKIHTETFTNVARTFKLTKMQVLRIFDQYVQCVRQPLSKVICFDEVYTSKSYNQKYAFVMVDFLTSHILDVYSSRHMYRLSQNLSMIPDKERNNVSFIVIDMWDTYKRLAKLYFKHAIIAVDSFHVIFHLNRAITNIRLKVMRKYDKRTSTLQANSMYYYMLKKFHYFFTRNYENIYDKPIYIKKLRASWNKDEIRKYLLHIDPSLKEAYYLKEQYREFNFSAQYETCDAEFSDLRLKFLNSDLEEFREFGKLISRWQENMKNSFIRVEGRRLSNGPIEGVNSRIKTIMRNANGYKSFERLRNRIMYSINKDMPFLGTPNK